MGVLFDAESARDAAFHLPTYARKPVMFVVGSGPKLFDDAGREYLDFVAGIGSVNLGHAHPAVTSALWNQVAKLTQVSNLYHVEHRAELAETLSGLLGGGKAFFCNSGTEACEAAIKLARKWGRSRRGEGCHEIVTAIGSFHGRTLGSLAATGQPGKKAAFEPLPGGFVHVAQNDVDALDAAVGPKTCAVMLEPVQGEGGVHPCTPEYLKAARKLCDERDVLLVLDEVQTGMWRTGPAFAQQGYGVEADVTCIAKALANGLPVGAIVAKGSAADTFEPGDHGSTFGGGPAICVAALATIEALQAQHLGENAIVMGERLRAGLRALRDVTGAVAEVRGVGLMNAIELTEPIAAKVAAVALTQGFVINSIGEHVLRFLPPLVIGPSEIDGLLEALLGIIETQEGGAA
ncbi:MAG: aspartate aminotransferase family protein [Actinobacteria bacterium]|nr:MAG: aspartate aminotransferase family protein [Actinomycetota bacterium]